MTGVVPAIGRGGLQVHIVQQAGSVHLHAVQNMLLRRSRQEKRVHLQEERALPMPQMPVSFASLVFVANFKLLKNVKVICSCLWLLFQNLLKKT